MSAERLLMIYSSGGTDGVAAQISTFKSKLTN
jgi:hypothetical protein